MRVQLIRVLLMGLFSALALPIIDAVVLGGAIIESVHAGSAKIGGRRMGCRAARVRLSTKMPGLGAAVPGTIFLNPKLLRRYPSVTRRMIFLHECGHQYVGSSETAADCWAVKAAKRQGWLTERGIRTVCRSFAGSRGSGPHPPGTARCSAMFNCYRTTKRPNSRSRSRKR